MDQQKIQKFQQNFIEFQQNLFETITSENNEIKITINGKVEIIELKINIIMSVNDLEILLKHTINRAISQVSINLQKGLQSISQSNV